MSILKRIREKFVKTELRGSVDREYDNGEITVQWRTKDCIHAGTCFTDLPEVFDPWRRPWIDLSKANTEQIIKVVKACPTPALTFSYNSGETPNPTEEETNKTSNCKITLLPTGPAIIEGDFIFVDEEAHTKECTETITLCRCGKSKNMPYCDGSHHEV